MGLPFCWEIKKCGRQAGGHAVAELGVCPAHPNHGHSCWTVAGTFCGGKVQGTCAQKLGFCNLCEVYKQYSTGLGSRRAEFEREHPAEFAACRRFLATLQSGGRKPGAPLPPGGRAA